MKSIVNKPWGSYQIIDQGENFVVKKLCKGTVFDPNVGRGSPLSKNSKN